MRTILVAGATSAIAEATCRFFALEGDRLYLVARHEGALRVIADDLIMRGAKQVEYEVFDLTTVEDHKGLIERAEKVLGGLDTLFVAHGSLPVQTECERSFSLTSDVFMTNALSVISLSTHIANYFERKKTGTILVISSVAGDRGRKSNYIYGSAKGAVTLFLQGLRNRLHSKGVKVITILPGFVDTPMTASYKKGLLWSSPETIAKGIMHAIKLNKNVVYLPGFWRLIMVVLKHIPEFVFKKLNI